MKHKALWSVSLSDGSSYQEGTGDYAVIEGELSPWRRLLAFIDDNKLAITSMAIRSGESAWNLPSAGKNPKFKAFYDVPPPIGYRFFRKMGVDTFGQHRGAEDHFSVIEAEYADGHLMQIWVDEKTLASWTLMI